MRGMEELIEALHIFNKYNKKCYIECEHDVLYLCDVNEDIVSAEDKARLDKLGFFVDEDDGEFMLFT